MINWIVKFAILRANIRYVLIGGFCNLSKWNEREKITRKLWANTIKSEQQL